MSLESSKQYWEAHAEKSKVKRESGKLEVWLDCTKRRQNWLPKSDFIELIKT